jgi:hypothetical protein
MRWPETLDIDLDFGGFGISANIPLSPFEEAFSSLQWSNREARARDEHPELRPCIRVRIECPDCGAPIFQLTAVVREGELMRACRCCRSEFSLAA